MPELDFVEASRAAFIAQFDFGKLAVIGIVSIGAAIYFYVKSRPKRRR